MTPDTAFALRIVEGAGAARASVLRRDPGGAPALPAVVPSPARFP